MTAAVGLAGAAWLLTDVALLLTLVGIIVGDDVPGNRLLLAIVTLAMFCALNAWAIDGLGRHFALVF